MKLLRRPQFVKVRLDADMAPRGPLRQGAWPGRKRVLTYHYFGKRRLRRGTRVAVNDGLYKNCFGTVIGRSRLYNGYTYGIRRTRREKVTIQVTETTEKTAYLEVA